VSDVVLTALVTRAAAFFGSAAPPVPALSTSLSSPLSIEDLLTDYDLDSMDLIELLLTIGEEVGLDLLDRVDDDRLLEVSELVDTIDRDADPARVTAWCDQWAPADGA
jgi:acyl carrier protein